MSHHPCSITALVRASLINRLPRFSRAVMCTFLIARQFYPALLLAWVCDWLIATNSTCDEEFSCGGATSGVRNHQTHKEELIGLDDLNNLNSAFVRLRHRYS